LTLDPAVERVAPLALPLIAMRRYRSIVDAVGLAIVLAAAIFISMLTHQGMANIRDGLPSALMQQQNDIAILELGIARAQHAVLLARSHRDAPRHESAVASLREVTSALDDMRRSYSFDSVYGASAAHALVYPVVGDISRWLNTGVSGYGPTSSVVLQLAYERLAGTLVTLREWRAETGARARMLLSEESRLIENLRRDLLIAIAALGLLGLLGLLALSFALAIMRQRNAEGRAALARSRLGDAMNSADVGIALFDTNDQLALCNKRFTDLYPLSGDTLGVGTTFDTITGPINDARSPGDEDNPCQSAPLSPPGGWPGLV
jgi:PAS domain-containing protein